MKHRHHDTGASLLLSKQLYELLAHEPPGVQGAAIGDLVSLYIAGHHPAVRDEVFASFIEMVKKLIPESVTQIIESRGGSDPWQKQ